MSKLVRLQLTGKPNQDIFAQLIVSGAQSREGIVGKPLPSPKAIIAAYQDWQYAYKALVNFNARKNRISDISVEQDSGLSGDYSHSEHCLTQARKFIQAFNTWLRSTEFILIREALRDALRQYSPSPQGAEDKVASLGDLPIQTAPIQFLCHQRFGYRERTKQAQVLSERSLAPQSNVDSHGHHGEPAASRERIKRPEAEQFVKQATVLKPLFRCHAAFAIVPI